MWPLTAHSNSCWRPTDLPVQTQGGTIALDGEYAGEHLFVTNRALRRGSAEDVAKLVRGEAVDPSRIYFRCAPTFEVSTPKLQWMTQSLFVGSGARETDRVHISLYRLV